ncbi:MAG: IS1634 family transposase [Pseudomonadota bacterium]|nr:IS1634 family transposase [Pseudomonadota bacterium]
MNPEKRYETQRIDHLGIVAGISHEIGLVEQIDQKVGKVGRKVSCGQAVLAMVLNALGFSSRALYLMSDYLRNKPVDLLIGPEMAAEDFNDDTLGRSLDDLYISGVTEVFASAAARALQVYRIEHQFMHVDSSSFHLHGQYEESEADTEAITIERGYSRDHRPDLKQIVVQLITSQQAALPVWLEVLSGNSSDKKSFIPTVQAYCQQMAEGQALYFVMDSAGYAEDNLKNLGGTLWLMRVPETLADAKRLVKETECDAMTKLGSGYCGKEVSHYYGGIEQRWLIVFSEAAYQRELQTMERKQTRERTAAKKQWRKVCQQIFNCQADAETACTQFNKRWKYHKVTAQITPITQYARRGRPAAEDQPEVVGYNLKGELRVNETGLDETKRSLGKFIIATNDLDAVRLPANAMLAHYTAQGVTVERGFRFLKDPLFFAHSLFLKKPERIMALVMIMGLALLIYALAERKLRQALEHNNGTVPNQKGLPTQNPTMRWIFQTFEGIDVLSVWQNEQLLIRQVLNLRPVHQQVLHMLGPPVKKCYLIDS